MSEFSSFYGGRAGAPFIVVKRFDGVDIPEGSAYRVKVFAQDDQGYFIVPLVEKTDNNYKDYSNWGTIPCDGSTTVISQAGIESEPLAVENLEGMRQCFEKGGETTSEVNYGEYVIIDTLYGRGDKQSPDNGKIYRRGYNYDYNPVTNPLAGAEYIGQVAGPPGSSPAIQLDTVENVERRPGASQAQYTVPNQGLVPGKYIDEHGEIAYNDELKYAWVDLADEQGEAQVVLVGFSFPFMVSDFDAKLRKPYYQAGDIIPAGKHIGDLIEDNINCIQRKDDDSHPFYREWEIEIPKGIKGESQSNLEIYPTKVVDGSKVYSTVSSTGELSNPRPFTAEDLNLDLTNYEVTKILGYAETEDGGYVYLTDTRGLRMKYLQTSYDEREEGVSTWIDLGEYNTISKVDISDEGKLIVYYSNQDPDALEEAIRWIKYTGESNTDGIQFNSDGTVTVTYNTKDAQGNNETQTFSDLISWITSVTINRNGHFKTIYNNNSSAVTKTGTEYGKAIYETDLTWPTQASLNAEGVLKFLYNNNLLDDIYPSTWRGEGTVNRTEGSYSFIIPWLEQVRLLEDGHFNFVFNNNKLYDDTDPNWKEDQKTYAPEITWVTKATLSENGEFKIYYNNELNKQATIDAGGEWVNDNTGKYYRTYLKWITKVTIDADGTVHFWYSDNTEMTSIPGNMKIKCIDNIYIDTDGMVKEGDGDQKLHIVYNTFEQDGVTHQEDIVGEPINYILDTKVLRQDDNNDTGLVGHLYVYFSDPERRAGSTITLHSDRLNADVSGWIDLGDVKGDTNAQLVFAEYPRLTSIPNKAPELIMGREVGGTIVPNYRYAGWGAMITPQVSGDLYHLALYDYINSKWTDVGVLIDRSGIKSSDFIIWQSGDVSNLKKNGFIIDASTIIRTVN